MATIRRRSRPLGVLISSAVIPSRIFRPGSLHPYRAAAHLQHRRQRILQQVPCEWDLALERQRRSLRGRSGKRRYPVFFGHPDPSGVLGTGADYPYLTLSLTAPQGLATGTKIPFSWNPGAWLTSPAGPLDFIVKPGTVTIGGSVYIDGVYPGGGTFPAGTLVRVLGAGFQPNIRIQTPFKYSSLSVGPNEIHISHKQQTTLDSQMFQVTNPDGSTATYFAYLKGTLIQQPSTELLQNAELAFPLATHAIASVGPAAALPTGQWQGLALQNPQSRSGSSQALPHLASQPPDSAISILLPSGGRIADSLTALLNGASVQPGDTVQLNSTAPVQIMGLNGDDQAETLAPFVPSF